MPNAISAAAELRSRNWAIRQGERGVNREVTLRMSASALSTAASSDDQALLSHAHLRWYVCSVIVNGSMAPRLDLLLTQARNGGQTHCELRRLTTVSARR